MPRWQFLCPTCGDEREQTFPSWREMQAHPPHCQQCETHPELIRVFPKPNFIVGGQYTARNGYSDLKIARTEVKM